MISGQNKLKQTDVKWPLLDRYVNRATIILFAVQIVIVLLLGITGSPHQPQRVKQGQRGKRDPEGGGG